MKLTSTAVKSLIFELTNNITIKFIFIDESPSLIYENITLPMVRQEY